MVNFPETPILSITFWKIIIENFRSVKPKDEHNDFDELDDIEVILKVNSGQFIQNPNGYQTIFHGAELPIGFDLGIRCIMRICSRTDEKTAGLAVFKYFLKTLCSKSKQVLKLKVI